jgi:hypothetical protein
VREGEVGGFIGKVLRTLASNQGLTYSCMEKDICTEQGSARPHILDVPLHPHRHAYRTSQ